MLTRLASSPPLPCTLAARRRGSILILVLALLSILLILATTLSFTSRLEMAAAENFARGVQGRFAALGALSTAAAIFAEDPAATHFLQTWALFGGTTDPAALQRAPQSSIGQASPGLVRGTLFSRAVRLGPPPDATPDTPGSPEASDPSEALRPRLPSVGMAHLVIEDVSARLDLNRVGVPGGPRGDVSTPDLPAQFNLAAFLRAALEEAKLDPAPAEELARAIIRWRLGPDGQPGAAGVDDDADSAETAAAQADEEEHPAAALVPAESDGRDNDGDGVVDEVAEGVDEPDEFQPDPRRPPNGDDRHYERIEDLLHVPGMTPEIFAAVAPHVTVHSFSATAGRGGEKTEPLLDVNRAGYQDILDHLRRHFPRCAEEQRVQFTLNILDARDADRVPSQPPDSAQQHPPLGVEMTPLINEVWPDSETEDRDGDDGQYVEICNPYPETFDLTGWTLRTPTGVSQLRGLLQPQGVLILTDDFDEAQDPEPEDDTPGYGSFVEIFAQYPSGTQRLLVEDPRLDLPNGAGWAELRDGAGNLIDWFSWSAGSRGQRLSLQRNDPRVRRAESALCSPFETNRGAAPPETFLSTYATALPLDRPFASPADLMFVFAAWAGAGDPEQRGWWFPAIHSPGGETLDSRLVDIFSVGPLGPMPGDEPAPAGEADSAPTEEGEAGEARETAASPRVTGCERVVGRLNVNTASRPVLRALAGVDAALAQRILDWRAQVELTWREEQISTPPFRARGDLLRNDFLWEGRPLRERLERCRAIVNAVTVSSATLQISATAANERGRGTPSTAPISIDALVEVDGRSASLVYLDFPRGTP